jgi:hypothetical protein
MRSAVENEMKMFPGTRRTVKLKYLLLLSEIKESLRLSLSRQFELNHGGGKGLVICHLPLGPKIQTIDGPGSLLRGKSQGSILLIHQIADLILDMRSD